MSAPREGFGRGGSKEEREDRVFQSKALERGRNYWMSQKGGGHLPYVVEVREVGRIQRKSDEREDSGFQGREQLRDEEVREEGLERLGARSL